ncbi:MAG: ribonuclease E/G, partial [bacterium]
MKRVLLMESLCGETRLAAVEDGRLCELYVERPGGDDVTGSIYLGRVENVVPGMNAAFVDIGQEKNGFLYAGDIQISDKSLSEKLNALRIEKLARPGKAMLVQVVKAQSGQKGHRLSCHVTLPGRLMVLLTDVAYIGVSRKITDSAERDRLRGAVRTLTGGSGMGAIIRTAAANATREALEAEWESLVSQWREIQTKAEHGIAPKQVYSNTSLILRCVRDLLDDTVDAVWTDGRTLYDELISRADDPSKIRLHDSPTPLFDLYRVDAQLDKALRKYVWLKSGGSLVIEQTEAMTVVDVNTAKFTGKKDLEDTLFRLNCEAAEELVRQLRL